MNGNIALSMEIGSAYVLQVCLLQIPALVLFSAVFTQLTHPADAADALSHSFK
jgi:Ca2+:H+ antiporter